jgi:cytochrome c-type protein NapC
VSDIKPEEKIPKKRKWTIWVGGIAALVLVMVLSWMVLETGIEVTSRAEFCSVCHVMDPMVESFKASMHGGNNPRGITSACTDCHVSHENVFTHFVGKARSGTHDIWVVLTTDETKNDWQALRERREEYVYDSGCLTCHQNLEKATADTKEHTYYFAGQIDEQCVSCHEEVGHSNLNKYLLMTKYATGE